MHLTHETHLLLAKWHALLWTCTNTLHLGRHVTLCRTLNLELHAWGSRRLGIHDPRILHRTPVEAPRSSICMPHENSASLLPAPSSAINLAPFNKRLFVLKLNPHSCLHTCPTSNGVSASLLNNQCVILSNCMSDPYSLQLMHGPGRSRLA